jgi:putative flippase GtrA
VPGHFKALTKTSIASLIATGVEFAILPVLARVFRVPHWICYMAVQFVANAISFLLYKYWAFEARDGAISIQYAKQLLVFGGSLTFNTLISSLLSYRHGAAPELAFAISNVIVYLSWNYPANRYWVFRVRG